MKEFFGDDILLEGSAAHEIYEQIKDLPIIDYHSHLCPKQTATGVKFNNIGEAWLATDHYKWRAMRLCGVDERLISGNADWKEKFVAYASILPSMAGNPIYFWSHMELLKIFGIRKPLNAQTAEEIYEEANEKIKNMTSNDILSQFNVRYIATTDDPADDLTYHGKVGDLTVAPTFRPDKILAFDSAAIARLSKASDTDTNTYAGLKDALTKRLDFFVQKGCTISDHAFADFPKNYLSDADAEEAYLRLTTLNADQLDGLRGNLMLWLMRQYRKREMVAQLRFSVVRNVNTPMFARLGVDTGFDVMTSACNYRGVIKFLDLLTDEERPTIILYSLNPNATAPLACLSGAFRNVYIGAAWWFNDTLEGIKNNLLTISEYASIGTHPGMLTDSRSFLSYSRFDFFRRILSTFIGQKVDRGEYWIEDALRLAEDISYNNIKKMLRI